MILTYENLLFSSYLEMWI